jgi:glycosyltransferase involved in cell wall biosynthesis
VNAFAAAIVRLAADPALCNSLGSAARDHVARNYSWDQAAERLEQIYARVVPRERPAAVVTRQ